MVLADFRAFGQCEGVELQRWVLIYRTDAGVTSIGQGICPFFRPAAILSGSPSDVQGFSTF